YYIRRGDLLKIGTTVNPVRRFNSLLPDEILAFEPGGRAKEASRHAQFAHLRVSERGEYFFLGPDLVAHAAEVRDRYGDPDPTWPTTVSIVGRPHVRPRQKPVLPPPTSTEVVTAAEGARRLGINRNTIHGWAHRGLIKSAGSTGRNWPTYYLDHLRFLVQHHRAWFDRGPNARRLAV
ncbi:hypothetical protein ACFVHV_09735, partial [Kitasatospora sp. NPDC127116]